MTKKTKEGKRKLMVYSKYLARAYSGAVIMPQIRLCGKWLRDMGFDCGDTVTVTHEQNRIIITSQPADNTLPAK